MAAPSRFAFAAAHGRSKTYLDPVILVKEEIGKWPVYDPVFQLLKRGISRLENDGSDVHEES